MLTSTNFNAEDCEIFEKNKKGYKIYFFIYFIFLFPFSFLIGLVGLSKKGYGYWLTTTVFLIFFFLLIAYLIAKDYLQYKKDDKSKEKYVGTITVLKKSGNKADCKIYTDSKELKKIDVLFINVFDQIEVGDELYIEVAKSSKFILKLEKGILPLLNGS